MLSVSTGFTWFHVATFSHTDSVDAKPAELWADATDPPNAAHITAAKIVFCIASPLSDDHPNGSARRMPNQKLFPHDNRIS
jgi:hypothetical protein